MVLVPGVNESLRLICADLLLSEALGWKLVLSVTDSLIGGCVCIIGCCVCAIGDPLENLAAPSVEELADW